ncbi:MAG: cupredoxin domain-containing protein [Nanoarchaeota archaeon]|nr:cupredoxin domain-containing protein [Nanoarchaeota archaeon]
MRNLLFVLFVLFLLVGCSSEVSEPKQVEPVIGSDTEVLDEMVLDIVEEDSDNDDSVEEILVEDEIDDEVVIEEEVVEKPEEVKVAIRDQEFQPSEITIKPNTKVTWTNYDREYHLISGEGFVSKILGRGGVFTYLFDVEGEFVYNCTMDSSLSGMVVVEN